MPRNRIHLERIITSVIIRNVFQSSVQCLSKRGIVLQDGLIRCSQCVAKCTVGQKQELREQITEQSGSRDDNIDSLTSKFLNRNQLQFFYKSSRIPDELYAKKLKNKGQHRSFIARCFDRP